MQQSKRRPRQLAAALLVVGIILGVYVAGAEPSPQAQMPAGHPDISSMEAQQAASGQPTVDEEAVATLMGRLQEDPRDVEAMRALGQEYYAVGDFAHTAQWQEQILALHPDDVDAMLALGVAQFSQGNPEQAEQTWNRALGTSPDQAEVHYNLGFLYMSQNRTDEAAEAWAQVSELAPGSDMAATVESHGAGLTAPAREN